MLSFLGVLLKRFQSTLGGTGVPCQAGAEWGFTEILVEERCKS